MATSTTNLGLTKPAGTDKIRIAQINGNMDILDEKIGAVGNTSLQAQVTSQNEAIANVQNGLAYIVGNTNTTGSTLAVGQFVYVKGHSTIAEGLYKVTASISADGSITTSNTSACSEGGLNALNDQFANLYTQYSNSWVSSLSVTLPKQGAYLFVSQRYAQMDILIRFQNGNTSASNISGSNWTFTNGTNGNITATATNNADYYIIPLIPTT